MLAILLITTAAMSTPPMSAHPEAMSPAEVVHRLTHPEPLGDVPDPQEFNQQQSLHKALTARIRAEPEVFAELIAERYLRMYETLDAFEAEVAYSMRTGQSRSVGFLIPLLGRDLAEPILLAGYRRNVQLEREAAAQLEKAQRAWEAAGRPKPGKDGDPLAALREEMQLKSTVYSTLQAGMAGSIELASEVGSPVFVDEAVNMLQPVDGFAAQIAAPKVLPYLEQFAPSRPDVYVRLKQLEQNLESHKQPTDNTYNEQRLLDALRPAVERMERILLPPPKAAPPGNK